MTSLREFAAWRPDVDVLDDATAEAIWASIVGEETQTDDDQQLDDEQRLVDRRPSVTLVPTTSAERGRWWPFLGAAAAVLASVAGIVVLDRGRAEAPGDSVPTQAAAEGWSEFPAMPIEPRFQYAAVSTGTGIFVWGGCCAAATGDRFFADGSYFDGDHWRTLPGAPLDPSRGDALAAWTGSEVIVMNGVDGVTAAAFDPATWTWRSLTAPDTRRANNAGSRLIPVGDDRLALVNDATVEFYDVAGDFWSVPVTIDGIELDNPLDDAPPVTGYGATASYLVASTTTDVDPCSAVRLRIYGIAAMTWSAVDPRTTDWFPTDAVGLPDGRFLVVGGEFCGSSPTRPPRAMLLDPVSETFEWVAPPPVTPIGFRYGGIVAGDAVVYLDQAGSLLVYRPASDTWAMGSSLLADNPNTDATIVWETPLLWFDGRIVVVSPGYARTETGGTEAWSCCYPTGDAWASPLPMPADDSDRAETERRQAAMATEAEARAAQAAQAREAQAADEVAREAQAPMGPEQVGEFVWPAPPRGFATVDTLISAFMDEVLEWTAYDAERADAASVDGPQVITLSTSDDIRIQFIAVPSPQGWGFVQAGAGLNASLHDDGISLQISVPPGTSSTSVEARMSDDTIVSGTITGITFEIPGAELEELVSVLAVHRNDADEVIDISGGQFAVGDRQTSVSAVPGSGSDE